MPVSTGSEPFQRTNEQSTEVCRQISYLIKLFRMARERWIFEVLRLNNLATTHSCGVSSLAAVFTLEVMVPNGTPVCELYPYLKIILLISNTGPHYI